MAASAYHLASTELENHISKHNWIFRHMYLKTAYIDKELEFEYFCANIYSYFRYTGVLFLRCALFAARCNTIRGTWETKKERLSYRKK